MACVTINHTNCDPNKNLLDFPNVVVPGVTHNSEAPQRNTNITLYEALLPIVKAHPEWKFTGHDSRSGVICAFSISKDTEEIGVVNIEWKGANYKIRITNHRIESLVSRGNSKYTTDPKVAEKLIRKYFYPKLLDERVTNAVTECQRTISSEHWSKDRELQKCESKVFSHAADFVRANLSAYVDAHPSVAPHIPKLKEAMLDMQTVKSVQDAFNNGKYVLVVLDQAEYIVRQGDVAKVYNNDTLPENLRAKIGILKLVNDGQMVSGVGCKTNATTLILIDVEEPVQA